MRQIQTFIDQTEGTIAKEALESQGFKCELQGVRDYSSVVVGGNQGRYSLWVEDSRADEAEQILRRSSLRSVEEHATETAEVALKKAVMFCFIAIVMIPIIGNLVSIRQAWKYARLEKPSNKKWLWLMAISWLQIPGIVVGWIIIKNLFLSE